MRNDSRILGWIWAFFFCLVSCKEVESPLYLSPELELDEAADITRTSAVLSGKVSLVESGEVTEISFRYGTSEAMENTMVCSTENLYPNTMLQDLMPNTTYYYCLEAGNGYAVARSETGNFTTQPNEKPVVEGLHTLGQGPLSVILRYELKDDGGLPVTEAGFYYQSEGGEIQCIKAELSEGGCTARIKGLKAYTRYTVQGFASNSEGEGVTEKLIFQTGQAVYTTSPGMLPELMGEDEKHTYTTLNVAGPINGTDIRFIREMLGKDVHGEDTRGRLEHLDLTDVSIVSGGVSYNGSRYTEDNVISCGMFANCPYLQYLALPEGAVKMEDGALDNCPELIRLVISASMTEIVPPSECGKLSSVEVIPGNPAYTVVNGLLYNKELTALFWCPEGMTESITEWPDALLYIGAYAFRNVRQEEIVLPPTVKKLGEGAFCKSRIKRFIVPDLVEVLPMSVFQGCGQLAELHLGRNMGYLGGYCFAGCPLADVYIPISDFPPMCQSDTFEGFEYGKTCTLHVPSGCEGLYRDSSGWGIFQHISGDCVE